MKGSAGLRKVAEKKKTRMQNGSMQNSPKERREK